MNKKLIIIIALVLILAIVGGAVYYFVFYEAPIIRLQYPTGDPYVTNVADQDKRLFKVGVSLVLDTDDAKIVTRLDENSALIRDTVIFIIRTYTEDDLKDPNSHDRMRSEIISALNNRFEFEHVVDVMFTDYVMQ